MAKKKILVTGYGPFGEYKVNPSSVICAALENLKISDDLELFIKVIDVDYDEALKTSKLACDELNVDFALHFGVHSEKCITLETRSFGNGYSSLDVRDRCPDYNSCSVFNFGKEEKTLLKTCFDCESLKNSLVKDLGNADVVITLSDDPGRYLCAYIYFCSLYFLDRRSLFIHIPPLDSIYTEEVLVNIAKFVITKIAEFLNLNVLNTYTEYV